MNGQITRTQIATLVLLVGLGALSAPARADGTTAAWGWNGSGQVANGSTATAISVPSAISSLSSATVLQLAATNNSSPVGTACAVTAEGKVYCWGSGASGQMGNGTTTSSNTAPVAVSMDSPSVLAGKTVVQLGAASATVCAATTEGLAYCWGAGASGTLGNGSNTASSLPVAVTATGVLSGKFVTQLSGAGSFMCVLASGAPYCWGLNGNGQLGNGDTANQNVPVAVTTSGVLSGKTLTQVDAGLAFACALSSAGLVYCWGANGSGQLGDGTTTQSTTPVAVSTSGALSGKKVIQISAGDLHACAVTDEFKAYCWGGNLSGQLGTGSTSTTSAPVAVDTSGALAGKKVVAVAAAQSTCALTSDGGIYCWGPNNNGQLGNNSTTASSSPVAVTMSGALSGKFTTQIAALKLSTAGSSYAAAPAGGPGRDMPAGSSATWQQVALACTPSGSSTVAGIFGSGTLMNLSTTDYGTSDQANSKGWILRRYNPVTNAYETLSSTANLTRGTGYWFKSYQSGRIGKLIMNCPDTAPSAPVTQAEGCASASGCFAIPLTAVAGQNRYNLLGNPFPYAVDWGNVRVRINGSSTTYTPSQAAGVAATGNAATAVISNIAYVWNGTSYTSFSDSGPTAGSLPYFRSFWVKVLAAASGQTVELLVPAQSTTLGTPFARRAPLPAESRFSLAAAGAGGWHLRFRPPLQPVRASFRVAEDAAAGATPAVASSADLPRAETVATAAPRGAWSVRLGVTDPAQGWTFDGAFVGQQPGASVDWDPQDMPAMAPFTTPYLWITQPRPTWGEKAGDYASDFRPAGQLRPGDWAFDLRASQVGSTVYLTRKGDRAILSRSQLVNMTTGAVIPGNDPRWSAQGIPVVVTATSMPFVWRYLGPRRK